jgi:hypothetical protein
MQAGALPDKPSAGAYFGASRVAALFASGGGDHMMDHDSVAINFLPPSVPPDKISSNSSHCGSLLHKRN